MPGYDFAFFYDAAHAILSGASPYSVPGYFSPPAFACALVPLSLFSFWLAFGIWTSLNLIALVLLARRRAHLALLFLPVIFHLYVGQVDLLILAVGLLGGWPGLALSTLKPQLALFLFLYHRYDRRRIVYAGLGALLLHLPTLPYLAEWQAATPSLLSYAEHASSLFGLSALTGHSTLTFGLVVLFSAFIFFRLRPGYWNWVAAFNPVSNAYSLVVLVPSLTWSVVALSWITLPLAMLLHTGLPHILLPLAIVLKRRPGS